MDETLIFSGANLDHLHNLRCLFLCFEVLYSLRINLAKSKLVPIGNVINVEVPASILGCKISSLPMTYLGLLLEALFKPKSIWDGIFEQIGLLTDEMRIYFSEGGRVTLIKSALSNLPTYFFSHFPLLVGVVNHIMKLQRNFLWGGTAEEFKFYLVNWSKVCSPILGGLGVHNLLLFDQAFWGSGFGVMYMREGLCGGWGFERISRGAGGVI